MENEKLESQKIDESKMENVAGGYQLEPIPFLQLTRSILLNDEEKSILEKAGYIEHSKDSKGEYISRSKYKDAIKLLKKEGKFDVDESTDDIICLGTGCESIDIR